jgi:hypothetical protein
MSATIPQVQFVTLAIGATAKQMGITTTELYNRMKRFNLVQRLLFDCYDTLHAESIDGVVWNIQEALKNWELREKLESDGTHSHSYELQNADKKGGKQ